MRIYLADALFGEVIVEEDKKPEFIRYKSLKFYVSVLGPFFAIHGIDSSIALLPYEGDYYSVRITRIICLPGWLIYRKLGEGVRNI